MSIQFMPITAAVAFLVSSQVYAAGGAAGENGTSYDSNGDVISVTESVGSAGTSGSNADGGNGAPIDQVTAPPIVLEGATITGTAGGNGKSPDGNKKGGGGVGGQGGGSVFGGISTGGAGGESISANGGNGGDVTGNTIEITNSTLTGAAGGAGGEVIFSPSSIGVGGAAGHGGGAVFGGISTGGAAGYSDLSPSSANGGNGGDVTDNAIEITNATLKGAVGGAGGSIKATSYSFGGSGAAGHGGGSVFGGISTGGAGGFSSFTSSSNGGKAGDVTDNTIVITNSTLTGAAGGAGGYVTGNFSSLGGGGAAGHGGGAVFGGISTGGAGGTLATNFSSANGGNGGRVTDNQITLKEVELDGRAAAGGDSSEAPSFYGGSGAAGHGGGSVFGGISTGGAGGAIFSSSNGGYGNNSASNGGYGGDVTGNTIEITKSTLKGGSGGNVQASSSYGGGGAGGIGGGSVVGGISTGGAGGYASSSGSGGNGGRISYNQITIEDSTLIGAVGGTGGASSGGGNGASGQDGGSVFGGISTGGAGGGWGQIQGVTVNGGNGGDVTNNKINISGASNISGSIYGGISQGGRKGTANSALEGKGGLVNNNTVTLIGDQLTIYGSIFGGLSLNGDGSENIDTTYSSYYAGNTLQIQSGHFLLKGSIKNFQNYNWLLPENEFNNDKIITVDPSGQAVDINNTIHNVEVQATGNVLEAGDKVILITKVTGQPALKSRSRTYIEQGFFIVYDAEMAVQQEAGNDALVLNVLGVNGGGPDGKIHPESEEFLKGRIAQVAMVDQGADMISDGISYARASLIKENANLFAIVDGGSSKYKNGGVSTLKLNDFKFALGAAKAFKFENKSVGMIAAFAEYGNGNYSSYNNFDYFGDTRGSGKVRYSGVGLMGHMGVAGTDVSKVKNKPNIFDDKYGLYLDAALRVGHVKVDFHSADMVKGAGVEARYNTKSRYASAMLGAGYVWTLDAKSALDFYGRYTYSRLNGKDVQVVDEQMHAGAAHSKRLRLGARYGYAYSATTTPYAGLAFERNFTGDVSGSAYGFTIKETSLKGNTGIVEAGVMIKPKGADDPFSLRLGVQGYFGQRKGATADVRARYVF